MLAIAIVLIASLTMGRQMLQWWHDKPPDVLDMGPLDEAGSQWGANSKPVSLEFGDTPITVTRQVLFADNSQSALDVVRNVCQTALVAAAPPGAALEQSEVQQLETLAKLTPDVEQPGVWQLYTMGRGLPIVVGVKEFDSDSEKAGEQRPTRTRRVICWGLVFPGLSPGSWTAYSFLKRPLVASPSTDLSSPSLNLSHFKLPPDCQRTLLMQEQGQIGLLGFQGQGPSGGWQRHFSNWLKAEGWVQAGSWQAHDNGWSGKFTRRETGRIDDSTIQIQCHRQNNQSIGLIHLLPGRKPEQRLQEPAARGTQ